MTNDLPARIDHRKILEEHISAQIGRRALLKGIGAGILTAGAASVLPDLARAQQSGHMRIAAIKHIDTLDPHFTFFLSAVQIINNIHNGLLKVTYDGKAVRFEPDLAETWTLEDDRTHLFKLRAGVKFHDGTACDAEAVKFSLMRVKSGTPASPHAWKLALLKEVEIVDPLTVRLHFTEPYAFLQVALTGSTGRAGTIVSPAAVAKYGMDYGRNPVGTGPFKFVSWRDNDAIELEANPDYFEPGMPRLQRASFVLIDEPSTAVAALVSGQIDGMTDCPMQLVAQVKNIPSVTLYGEIEGNYTYVGMNNRSAPFNDVNLRRAVAFAIDREALLKQAFFGLAQQAYSPISPPMTGYYDPNIASTNRGHRFDLAKAKEFRAKAANQGEIEVTYIMAERGPVGTRIAQTVAPMLAKIGIKVKLELLEPAAWVQRMKDGNFQMLDFDWVADLDPEETIFPEFKTGGSWNYWGWSNPEFDRLCAEAQTMIDVPTRAGLYHKAEDILMDEAPIAMLAHMPIYKVFSKKVKGFNYVPCDLVDLHGVSLG
ncbi:dipeptide/oligopeptide ABC transporter substrate-binding protein (plasmid) [Rhizobium gallicum]|uniref:Dipeptide/oligopeptide ABC transporter substrate-binding protein n=1 Tax=Rhizobium gallicum TaxID=56730 RepID=A0A1L5NXY5_9HYPH|nr:ABC transporter substrate-binding protein [Rhizobium gallicum]APO72706.1 dipeptide/oligopeptide ABC transporter substrate-binding protein [Rhizobium gallicum]